MVISGIAFDFGTVLASFRANKGIHFKRRIWGETDKVIGYCDNPTFPNTPFFYVSEGGVTKMWIPTVEDLMATDYEVVD